MSIHISKLYLDQTGIAIFLGGETQAAVYHAVLAQPCTVRTIRRYVNERQEKKLAYTTVATIANKLCDKGILTRQNMNQYKPEYKYTALITLDDLIEMAMLQVFEKLTKEFPTQMVECANIFTE